MTMTSDFAGLNVAEYAIGMEESGARFPALQATIYQPGTITKKLVERMDPSEYVQMGEIYYERPRMGLSEEAIALLDPDQAALLKTTEQSFIFNSKGKSKETVIHVLPEDVRFTVLVRPKTFKLNKDTEEISYLKRGDKLSKEIVSISRLFLAVIVDGKPILTADGEVQVFTLKLTSNKTKLIGKEDQPGTIMALNAALLGFYKAKQQWLTHLVSLSIAPTPYQFTSNDSGETSTGIMFKFVGDAKPLPGDSQLQIFELVRGVDFQELAEDPFGLKAPEPVATAIAPAAAGSYDDMPF